LELLSNQAFLNDVNLGLTGRELDLLFLLLQYEGFVLSAECIYEKVWARPLHGDKNSIQAVISRLRKKIEPSGYGIVSIRGKGYVFRKE